MSGEDDNDEDGEDDYDEDGEDDSGDQEAGTPAMTTERARNSIVHRRVTAGGIFECLLL